MLLFGIKAKGRLCEECRDTFVANCGKQRFCSDRCQNRAHRRAYYASRIAKPYRRVKCPGCTKPFLTRRDGQKYCSPRCLSSVRWQIRRKGITNRQRMRANRFKCVECGGPPTMKVIQSTTLYCRARCRNRAEKRRAKEKARAYSA